MPHAVQPSRRFKPLGVASKFPWPGFTQSSRARFAKKLHKRSHQRGRLFSSSLVRPVPKVSRRSPRANDSKGTSCRRVQSTFFSFQRRATTSRAAIGNHQAETCSLPDEPFRSRGTTRFGESASEHSKLFVPMCRRSDRTSDAPSPSPTSRLTPFFRLGLARFPRNPIEGLRLPRTRTPSTTETPREGLPDPDRTVRSETSVLFAHPPGGFLASCFHSRGFRRRLSPSRAPTTDTAQQLLQLSTRPADTSAVPGPPTRSRAPG